MKRLQFLFIGLLISAVSSAQQTAFDLVFDGCTLAVNSLSDGSGSQTGMREAAEKLTSAKWATFNLKRSDGQQDEDLGDHLVFTEDYFNDLANNHVVKKKAEEYATERSGEGVKLCTKLIKAGASIKYSFNFVGGNALRIGAVAETNGLINLKVCVKKKGGKAKPTIYKENTNEYKGAANRQIVIPKLPSGLYSITIEITNKYQEDRSCAIIAD